MKIAHKNIKSETFHKVSMVSQRNLPKVSEAVVAKVIDFDRKSKSGRPTLYRDEYVKQAYKLCLLGATDKEIADFFEVNIDTIYAWKKNYPEFSESIKRGKLMSDAKVAESLYKCAIGFTHPQTHVSDYLGKVTITMLEKYYPPNVKACIFWLRNRQSKIWGR